MNPIPKTAVVRWLLCAPFFFSVCNSGVFKSLLLTDCVCDCWVDWIYYKRNVRVILLLCCCWRNWISHHLKLSAWSIDISVSNVVWWYEREPTWERGGCCAVTPYTRLCVCVREILPQLDAQNHSESFSWNSHRKLCKIGRVCVSVNTFLDLYANSAARLETRLTSIQSCTHSIRHTKLNQNQYTKKIVRAIISGVGAIWLILYSH